MKASQCGHKNNICTINIESTSRSTSLNLSVVTELGACPSRHKGDSAIHDLKTNLLYSFRSTLLSIVVYEKSICPSQTPTLEGPMLNPQMERLGQADSGFMHATHEYPDPDYAAYATIYPWREDDGYLPSALHDLPSGSLEGVSRYGNDGRPWTIGDDGGEVRDSDAEGPAREVTCDPDYQVSEAAVT